MAIGRNACSRLIETGNQTMRRYLPSLLPVLTSAVWVLPAHALPFLVTPLSFDFGDVHKGATSFTATVNITNTTSETLNPQLAGGAPFTANFGASQNCGGRDLGPGESCQIFYDFRPQDLGELTDVSRLSVGGELREIDLRGAGIRAFLATPGALDFGAVQVGQVSSQQVMNIRNLSDTALNPGLAGGAPFTSNFGAAQNCGGGDLAGGASCQIFYDFRPQESGALTDVSRLTIDGELAEVQLSGFGADELDPGSPWRVSARALNFGDVRKGETSPQQKVTITNVSDETRNPGLAGGAPFTPDFGASQNCGGHDLAPGESCELFFTLRPTVNGPLTDVSRFSLDDMAVEIALGGRGLDAFLVSTLALDFGEIDVGEVSPQQSISITNVSGATRNPGLAGGAPFTADFGASQNCGGRDLGPGESCQIFYDFRPTGGGSLDDTSRFTVDGRLISVALSGLGLGGTPPPPPPPDTVVPAPATLPLLGAGWLAFLLLGSRRRLRPEPPCAPGPERSGAPRHGATGPWPCAPSPAPAIAFRRSSLGTSSRSTSGSP
ncbi:choice-of-anchor D domain-containing protein [Albimonas sp. CAU 1670]|uniref:choice-of-anchor D domain-containing protein n=1 Tax=Albimonas sp. CAU 1670 TaxID=3032599 RepID=UPI0023D9BCD9|nr:choice-of-anchor D domain-containing protein [Albimonas sp. CAU 1670]MDF2235352.1 choice-of-anchor D domain-containing protein [Albimonas sp. CAU 1670]